MQVTFGELGRYVYFSTDERSIIYRKIDDTTAWIFRAYYRDVAVYEPVIGTPTDFLFSSEQLITVEEPPSKNRFYPQRAA